MATVHLSISDATAGRFEVISSFQAVPGQGCTPAQAFALDTLNRARHENRPIEAPPPMPICPTCGNNWQVWKNQITGHLTCHRAYCETRTLPIKEQQQEAP